MDKNKLNKFIFISGAYRGKSKNWLINRVQRFINIYKAYKLGRQLVKLNYFPIIPHLNTFWMDGLREDDFYLQNDLKLLSKCDGILLLKNWDKSSGSILEVKYVFNHIIKVDNYYNFIVLKQNKNNIEEIKAIDTIAIINNI